jgi:uncharacterized membrane protein YhhN
MASVYFQLGHETELFIVFKPLTTILIIVALTRFGSRQNVRFYYSMLVALCACLLGDIFLLKDAYFVFGLGAFLFGHLMFAYAFVSFGGFKTHPLSLLVLGMIGGGFYIYIYPSLGSLSVPVLIYMTVIILMAWQGVNMAFWQKTPLTLCIAVAVVLFMISDGVIAINKFIFPFEASSALILPTYWLSISLLSYSAILLNKEADNTV